MDPQALNDPAFLELYAQAGEAIEVAEGAHVSKDVPLITASTATAARN